MTCGYISFQRNNADPVAQNRQSGECWALTERKISLRPFAVIFRLSRVPLVREWRSSTRLRPGAHVCPQTSGKCTGMLRWTCMDWWLRRKDGREYSSLALTLLKHPQLPLNFTTIAPYSSATDRNLKCCATWTRHSIRRFHRTSNRRPLQVIASQRLHRQDRNPLPIASLHYMLSKSRPMIARLGELRRDAGSFARRTISGLIAAAIRQKRNCAGGVRSWKMESGIAYG